MHSVLTLSDFKSRLFLTLHVELKIHQQSSEKKQKNNSNTSILNGHGSIDGDGK